MHPRERHDVSELTAELFDKAADLPPEQRAAFLDEHLDLSNESDVAIRKEIERLLQCHDTSGILAARPRGHPAACHDGVSVFQLRAARSIPNSFCLRSAPQR